jgi:hypothetical protein
MFQILNYINTPINQSALSRKVDGTKRIKAFTAIRAKLDQSPLYYALIISAAIGFVPKKIDNRKKRTW